MARNNHRLCRPIQLEQGEKALLQPKAAAYDAGQPREAVLPLRKVADVTQEEVRYEPRPDLPLDRVLAVADEVVDLARLLELLEERLDPPPRPVELRYRPGGSFHVVRGKHDSLHLAADLHERRYPAQRSAVRRVLRRRSLVRRAHDLVGKDLRGVAFRVAPMRTPQPLEDVGEHA